MYPPSSLPSQQIEAAVRDIVLQHPNVRTWPLLTDIWQKATAPGQLRPAWKFPIFASQALGESWQTAVFAAAAIGCVQLSIIFVDDIMDNDIHGLHHQHGSGMIANLSLALQATATALLQEAPVNEVVKWQAAHCLNQMALDTAVGQYLDSTSPPLTDAETKYWQTIRAKSGPFFGAGLQMGAILNQMPSPLPQQLYHLGELVGDMVQIADDLEDIFDKQPHSDWQHPHKNLLLLYALIADYPQKATFKQHLAQNNLEAARELLIEMGAIHYALHTLQETQKEAFTYLDTITTLHDSTPLTYLLKQHDPLIQELIPLLS